MLFGGKLVVLAKQLGLIQQHLPLFAGRIRRTKWHNQPFPCREPKTLVWEDPPCDCWGRRSGNANILCRQQRSAGKQPSGQVTLQDDLLSGLARANQWALISFLQVVTMLVQALPLPNAGRPFHLNKHFR